MTNLNPDNARKQIGDEQSNPDTGPRIVRKRPRINAPMPIPSPYEERIKQESERLLKLYGGRRAGR